MSYTVDKVHVFGLVVVIILGTALPASAHGITERVSIGTGRVQSNDFSYQSAISADGRFVAFDSYANNLVLGDTNGHEDVFVHDRHTGKTERISLGSAGVQGNSLSYWPSISADGRFVAFISHATNLVPGDTNNVEDVFVRDRRTGTTARVSLGPGIQGDRGSIFPSISADGRFVAFESDASNLVPGDTNNFYDVFVFDRTTSKTQRVSVGSGGIQGIGYSGQPAISADGRFVAFSSGASNLVPDDSNFEADIFVHDRKTDITQLVSRPTGLVQSNGQSDRPTISADGRFVAFESGASNLLPGDINDVGDVFVRDRRTGRTERVSVRTNGAQGNDFSQWPSISADGRFVAFFSIATNLVRGDTNKQGDVFIHDRKTGATRRVSVGPSGVQGNKESGVVPRISADGRFVAFSSLATNLVPADTNKEWDVFVRSLVPGV